MLYGRDDEKEASNRFQITDEIYDNNNKEKRTTDDKVIDTPVSI